MTFALIEISTLPICHLHNKSFRCLLSINTLHYKITFPESVVICSVTQVPLMKFSFFLGVMSSRYPWRHLRREQVLNSEPACCWGPLIRLCPRLWVLHVISRCSTLSPGRCFLLEAHLGKGSFSLSLAGMQRFVTEGQHLQLTAITKEQSGSYECIASNDISSPDVRIVQVTVNCKSQNNKKKNLLLWIHSGWRGWLVGLKTFTQKYIGG